MIRVFARFEREITWYDHDLDGSMHQQRGISSSARILASSSYGIEYILHLDDDATL